MATIVCLALSSFAAAAANADDDVPAAAPVAGGERVDEFGYSLRLSSFDALSSDELQNVLSTAREAGATTIHVGAVWWWLNGSGPGDYNWSQLDNLVAEANRYDLDLVLQLTGTPDWVHPELASSVPDFYDRIWYPPVNNDFQLDAWATFVGDLVSRYGASGVRYEIWNEPNYEPFWLPAPSPAGYAKLLQTAYLAAKSANDSAIVVFGGLSTNDVGFLRMFYDAAEAYSDAASNRYFFDELGVHPYSGDRSPATTDPGAIFEGQFGEVDENFLGFRKMKAEMNANDDTSKGIFLTEYGFSTTETWMAPVPESVRAEYLKQAYQLAAEHEYVTGLTWYVFVELQPGEAGWAMLDRNLSSGATFDAFAEIASSPAAGTSGFVDDNGSIFEADIDWLVDRGVAKGCNPPANTRFCPEQNVTRGQMAAFLIRALGYQDDGGGDHFSDDDNSPFEVDIDKLYTAGITNGCNPPANTLYCPDQNVTRGQMAAFLRRSFG